MMKRKIIIFMCFALLVCGLSGCRLAQENAGTDSYGDRLVGIFVTTEYLDLFDFESYLGDNLGNFKDGNITADGNTQKYQGRLYAAMVTKTLTNEETGETTETEEYVFDGVDGIPFFSAVVPDAPGRAGYHTTISDEAIGDGHTGIYYGDDENRTTLKGTIYTAPSNKNHTYYFNPVYQSADGSVYAVSGGGFMISDESYSEGSVYSQTLTDTTTVTENGKAKTNSISVELAISVMFEPEKIAILQMDADSKILSRTEYAPGELPDAITPEPDTAYIITETYKRDGTGNITSAREICGRSDENIETFYARPDGICVKGWTQIKWK